jgi:cytochrome c peroxidase
MEALLCQSLPPPPPELEVPVVKEDPTRTTRERFAVHAATPSCAGCHTQLDGLAFALENYDPIGKYRTTENKKPIDASGTVIGTPDADGPFKDAPDLLARLAKSRTTRQCLVRRYVTFAVGRADHAKASCTVAALTDAVEKAGDAPGALFLALTRAAEFTARQ